MISNICKNCNKEFNKPHNPRRVYKFCSHQCGADFDSKTSKIYRNCKYCNNTFHPKRNNSVQVLCSIKCRLRFLNRGKTTEAQRIRSSLMYEAWRKAVFIRDKYTCQICRQVGGKLNADHIKRFSDYPELRLELSNGRTLCEPCHLKTETFGNRKLLTDTKWDVVAVSQET